MLKKKKFITFMLLLLIGALIFYAGKLSQKPRIELYPPGVVPERVMLTWSDCVYTTQTVTWRTDTTVHIGYAEIAPAAESAEEITNIKRITAQTRTYSSEVNTANYHTVKFSGLKPSTQYLYRVGNGKVWSEWFQFTTANNEPKNFSFLYFGDIQEGIKQHGSRVIRKGYSSCPNAAFMLFAGDMVDHPYDNDFGEFFYAGDWLFASTPVIAAPGNHEYKRNVPGGLGDIWKYQFNFPQNGPDGLKNTVYYLDYQGVRIIVLDTEGMKHFPGTFKKQSEWLESVLRNNPNHWTIVTMHHPVFSNSGRRDNPRVRKYLKPIFDKYNVDLVLEGHDHSYGRTEFRGSEGHAGPVYVITNAGPKMYDLGFTPQMKRLASRTQLYQVIDVAQNSIHFSSYTTTGKLYDSFVINKANNGRKVLVNEIPTNEPERVGLSKLFRDRFSKKQIAEYNKKAQERTGKDQL